MQKPYKLPLNTQPQLLKLIHTAREIKIKKDKGILAKPEAKREEKLSEETIELFYEDHVCYAPL